MPFDAPEEEAPPWAAEPIPPTLPKAQREKAVQPRPKQSPGTPARAAKPAAAHAPVLDQLLASMQQVNVGVSQSLRLARRAEVTPTGLALYFQKGDEVFISALAQYQQDLDACASEILGQPTQVHLQVERDDPDRRRKELEEIARKTGQALGVPVEIEE